MDKIQVGYHRSKESKFHASPPAQDSSARKISPHNFGLKEPAGIESVEEAAGALTSSSWGTHTCTHLLRLAPSELQHQGGTLKGTSDIQERLKCLASGGAEAIAPLLSPLPTEPVV